MNTPRTVSPARAAATATAPASSGGQPVRCWPLSTSTTTSTPYGASSRPARAAPSTESTPIATRPRSARLAQPLGGPLVDVDRVGDEQVGAAVPGEDLGLAERGHGEADRALAELEPGDLGRLVGLDVRTQRHPVRRGPLRGAAYVAPEPVEVDAEVRRRRRRPSELLVGVGVAAEQPAVRPGERR